MTGNHGKQGLFRKKGKGGKSTYDKMGGKGSACDSTLCRGSWGMLSHEIGSGAFSDSIVVLK